MQVMDILNILKDAARDWDHVHAKHVLFHWARILHSNIGGRQIANKTLL